MIKTKIPAEKHRIYRRSYLFAAVAFVIVAVHLLISSLYSSFPGRDEFFYYTIPMRLLQGDRLFVQEWHLSQLSSVLQLLPYLLYKLLGADGGIILYMRGVYAAITLILYWFFYHKLKVYMPFGAVIASMMFSLAPYFGMATLNYYNMGMQGLAVFLFILLANNGYTKARMVFAGVVYFCALLCQPGFAGIYVVYTIVVFASYVGKKRKPQCRTASDFDALFAARTWKFVSLGFLSCAVVFAVCVAATSGIGPIIKNIPGLLSDPEHAGSIAILRWKLSDILSVLGRAEMMILCLCAVCVTIIRRRGQNGSCRNRRRFALNITVSAALLAAIDCACRVAIQLEKMRLYNIVLALLSYILYMGVGGRNRKTTIFIVAVAIGSLGVDCLSNSTVFYAAALLFFPIVGSLCARRKDVREKTDRLSAETEQDGRNKETKGGMVRVLNVLIGVLLFVFVGITAALLSTQMLGPNIDRYVNLKRNDQRLILQTDGAVKGLRLTPDEDEFYRAVRQDLAEIGNGAFCCLGPQAFTYLDLDLPIGVYSTYITEDNENRLLLYWKLNPEKRPRYIYVPFGNIKNDEIVSLAHEAVSRYAFFKTAFSAKVRKLDAGLLLYDISDWKI